MGPVNTHDVTPELKAVAERIQAAGWTWRKLEDSGGPSGTKMGQLLAGEGRVRNDVLRKLDDTFGWEPGTALNLVSPVARVRRGALTLAVVGPPGQGRARGQGARPTGDREDDEIVASERTEIAEALRHIGQQLIDLAEKVSTPPERQ